MGNTGTTTDVSANVNEEEGDEETKKAKQGDGSMNVIEMDTMKGQGGKRWLVGYEFMWR